MNGGRTRHLDWDGSSNARDLGGLPVGADRQTRWRAVIRADAVDRLTSAGWSALEAYGVRTIIDLRNEDERSRDRAPRPQSITTLHLPLDGHEDTAHWDRLGKEAPLHFYREHLSGFPERSVRVVKAIAEADPGGVVIHCHVGRDRTGLVTMLLLRLVGVPAEVIAEDHALSAERLAPYYEHKGEVDQGAVLEQILKARGSSARGFIVASLAAVDVSEFLQAGGLTAETAAAVRHRLVEGAPHG
jgi:protein-tyrosine phosphatase